jgi:hypothetical protein
VAPKYPWCDTTCLFGTASVRSWFVPSHSLISCVAGSPRAATAFGAQGWDLTATIEGHPEWVARAVVLDAGNGPVVAELTVTPAPKQHGAVPAVGLGARLVRKVNVGELADLVRGASADAAADFEDWADVLEGTPDAVALREMAESVQAGPTPRPGRRGNGIDHYLTWAVRYAEKVSNGVRNPHKQLADEHDVPSWEYVRDTITDARRRYGLLTKPGPGKAGGVLTDKAKQLLAARKAGRNP